MTITSFAVFRLENELKSLQPLPNTSLTMVSTVEDRYVSAIEYTMTVSEGIYEGRVLHFVLKVPHEYPFKPPRLVCTDSVFHPNVDEDGVVCMEILRLGWTPGHGLENIFVNLYVIFIEVSGDDALNTAAGDLLKSDYERFVRIAKGLEKYK